MQNLVNVLRFGLENVFHPISNDNSLDSRSIPVTTSSKSSNSFVAWDPYPYHTVAAVKLAFDAIIADFETGRFAFDILEDLITTLLTVLSSLSRGSKFVEEIRETVEDMYCAKTRKSSIAQ